MANGSSRPASSASDSRAYLRQQLDAHLVDLGYSSVREKPTSAPAPEITRINPLRGRLVYGETVLRADLHQRRCHDRLLSLSQRRTRHRSSILLFIGVAADDEEALVDLLKTLHICGGLRGGHVHVLPIAMVPPAGRRPRSASAAR